jgi:hypothetical protein
MKFRLQTLLWMVTLSAILLAIAAPWLRRLTDWQQIALLKSLAPAVVGMILSGTALVLLRRWNRLRIGVCVVRLKQSDHAINFVAWFLLALTCLSMICLFSYWEIDRPTSPVLSRSPKGSIILLFLGGLFAHSVLSLAWLHRGNTQLGSRGIMVGAIKCSLWDSVRLVTWKKTEGKLRIWIGFHDYKHVVPAMQRDTVDQILAEAGRLDS